MSVKIVFDGQQAVYFAGQTIAGRVTVINHDSVSTKGVTIKFTGQGHTRWRTGSQKNRRTHIGNEEYYVEKVYPFGNGNDTVSLSPGQHVYPFNFTLPQNIPSSYESVTGQVRHQVKAKVNIPWGFDWTDIQPISVNHIYDLNRDENAMSPVNRKEKKTFTFSSGSLHLGLMIARIGFVPGEKLRVHCEVENDSEKVVEWLKMKLIQEVTYRSNSGTSRTDTMTTGKMRVEGITGRGKHVIWSNTGVLIPAVPASYLQHCEIIDIRYNLKLNMCISGWTNNMQMEQPIIIGSIPLQQHFSLYQMINNAAIPGASQALAPVPAAAWGSDNPNASADPRLMCLPYPGWMNIPQQQPSAPPTIGFGFPEPGNPSAPSLPGTVPGDNPPPYDPNWVGEKAGPPPPQFPGLEQYPEMPPPAYGSSQHSWALEDAVHSDGKPQRPFIPSYVTFNTQESRPGTPN